MSRRAAQRINITSDFSYTTEMLIQAGRKRMAVVSVPVRTNGAVAPLAPVPIDPAVHRQHRGSRSFASMR